MAGAWDSLARNAARGDVFHVIDTETTGAAPPGSRVIELACVSLVGGRPVDRFETLIDPGVPVPPFITRLTGISSRMLQGAPAPGEALARFAAYVEARPGHFVAHNASFDYRFLSHEFALAGLKWPFQGMYCTVRLSRHCNPQLRRHNLDSLIAHFGVAAPVRHRAMADVEATAAAFWRMVALLEPALAAPTPAPSVSWPQLIACVRGRSRTLAAMLEQHGALIGHEADGGVAIALPEPFLARLDAARQALLEAAVRELFGEQARLRLASPV